MKIAWTRMKGVCLLLLGLATTGGGRSFAADINTQNFATLAESSSATTAGTAAASPFKDESAGTSAKVVPVEPAIPITRSCRGVRLHAARDLHVTTTTSWAAPGRFWFRGEYLHWWTSGATLPPMVSTLGGPNRHYCFETLFGDQDFATATTRVTGSTSACGWTAHHRWGVEADYFDLTGKPDNYDSGFTNGFDERQAVSDRAAFVRSGSSRPGDSAPTTSAIRIFTSAASRSKPATISSRPGSGLRRQLRACEWSTCNGDVNWTDPSARTFRLDAIGGYRFARLIDTVDERGRLASSTTRPSRLPVRLHLCQQLSDRQQLQRRRTGIERRVYPRPLVAGRCRQGRDRRQQPVRQLVQPGDHRREQRHAGHRTPVPQNPTPLQEFSRNRFSAIPELTVTGGYQVTDHLKVTVGYDLLYWTAVVRAADQIAVEPTTGYPYGTVVGNFRRCRRFLERVALPGPGLAVWAPTCGSRASDMSTKKGQGTAGFPALFPRV